MANLIAKSQFTGTDNSIVVTSSTSDSVVRSESGGNPVGTISLVTDLTKTNLNDLSDVDASDPIANNSILIWDSTATKYKPTPLGNVTIDGGNI